MGKEFTNPKYLSKEMMFHILYSWSFLVSRMLHQKHKGNGLSEQMHIKEI